MKDIRVILTYSRHHDDIISCELPHLVAGVYILQKEIIFSIPNILVSLKYLTWNSEPKLEHLKNITTIAYSGLF